MPHHAYGTRKLRKTEIRMKGLTCISSRGTMVVSLPLVVCHQASLLPFPVHQWPKQYAASKPLAIACSSRDRKGLFPFTP